MPPIVDISNQRFGRLVVIRPKKRPGAKMKWECRCDCSTVVHVLGESLRSGATRSCGCLRIEVTTVRNAREKTKHGHRRPGIQSPTYRSWRSMKQRYSNPKHPSYSAYGARMIGPCTAWFESFEAFFADMGKRPPGTSLERIDNRLGYFKQNCRWATPAEQAHNRRNTKLTLEKVKEIKRLRKSGLALKQIATQFGVSDSVVSAVALGKAWKNG